MVKYTATSLEIYLDSNDTKEDQDFFVRSLIGTIRWFGHFVSGGGCENYLLCITGMMEGLMKATLNHKAQHIHFSMPSDNAIILKDEIVDCLLTALGWLEAVPEPKPEDKVNVNFIARLIQDILAPGEAA